MPTINILKSEEIDFDKMHKMGGLAYLQSIDPNFGWSPKLYSGFPEFLKKPKKSKKKKKKNN